jgi:hypothetical protein
MKTKIVLLICIVLGLGRSKNKIKSSLNKIETGPKDQRRVIMKTKILFVFFLLFSLTSGQMPWYRVLERGPWGPYGDIWNHTSLVFNNNLWVIGGYSIWTGNRWIWHGATWYSPDGVNWTCAVDSAPWLSGSGHTSVVFDNKMWIIGGAIWPLSWPQANRVWYSPDGVNWTCAVESAPWGYVWDYHTSVVFNNKIWVIGDSCGLGVWYSPDGVNWTCATESAPWGPRGGHASVVFHNKIWVIGGYVPGRGDVNDVWYSLDGTNWTCATNSAPWRGRKKHTAVVFRDTLWIMGGWSDTPIETFYGDVWYSPDGVNWTCATESAGWGRRAFHSSTVYNNRIWLIGGDTICYNSNSPCGDVWYSTGLNATEFEPITQPVSPTPTIIHLSQLSQFFQQLRQPAILFNTSGQKIDLNGANPIRHLKPGLYFLLPQRETDFNTQGRKTQKIILIN